MKCSRIFASALLLAGIAVAPLTGLAAEGKKAEASAAPKVKPYTLKTCVVSDEKLGEMGDPYVFIHEGRELKLCCKSCLKDFKKDPAKYIKKVEEAEKKGKKS